MSEILVTGLEDDMVAAQASPSAVSWAAVFAGGVSAAAVAVMLSLCGVGLGLASVSPWHGQGVSVAGFTVLAAIWLILVQWIASFVGGYMAGRLRTKYVAVHTDEVFFRDTAHGFLAWALAILFGAAVLGAAGAGSAPSAPAAVAGAAALPTTYYTGLLFRQPPGAGPLLGTSAPGVTNAEIDAQAATILGAAAARGTMPADDRAYLVQLVSERTGLNNTDAQARVSDVLVREQADVTRAKQVADGARKAASAALLYGFVSLLIGAFIASVAGAVGGRLRDHY
jgi:hypothetical protein